MNEEQEQFQYIAVEITDYDAELLKKTLDEANVRYRDVVLDDVEFPDVGRLVK